MSKFDEPFITRKLLEKNVYYKSLENEIFIALKWLFDNSKSAASLSRIERILCKSSSASYAEEFVNYLKTEIPFEGTSEFEKFLESNPNIVMKIDESQQYMDINDQLRIVFEYVSDFKSPPNERDLYVNLLLLYEKIFDITEAQEFKGYKTLLRTLFHLCFEGKEIFAYFVRTYKIIGYVLRNIDSALLEIKPDLSSILSILKEENNDEARIKALEWISLIGVEKEAIPYIEAILGNCEESPMVRKNAVTALRKIDRNLSIKTLFELLEDKDFLVQKEAMRILLEKGEKKEEILILLVGLGKRILPLINANLEEFDPWTIRPAQYVLSNIGKENISMLIENMKNEGSWVRIITAEILGQRKEAVAVEPLLNALKEEKEDVVCEYIVLALGKIGDKKAFETLLGLLGNPEIRYRPYIAIALGEFKDKKATKILIESIEDKNEHLRRCSAGALGKIGDMRAVPHLEKMIEIDVSEDAKKVALNALNKITGKEK